MDRAEITGAMTEQEARDDEREALIRDARTLASLIEPGRFDYGASDQAPRLLERMADALQAAVGQTRSEPSIADWGTTLREERARQEAKGYDAAHDHEHGVAPLLDWAIDYARRGKPVQSAALILAAKELIEQPSAKCKHNITHTDDMHWCDGCCRLPSWQATARIRVGQGEQ